MFKNLITIFSNYFQVKNIYNESDCKNKVIKPINTFKYSLLIKINISKKQECEFLYFDSLGVRCRPARVESFRG